MVLSHIYIFGPKISMKNTFFKNLFDNFHKEQPSSKKPDLYLNQGPRKSRLPLNLTDIQTYGRTDINIYRIASFIKKNICQLLLRNIYQPFYFIHLSIFLLDLFSSFNACCYFSYLVSKSLFKIFSLLVSRPVMLCQYILMNDICHEDL